MTGDLASLLPRSGSLVNLDVKGAQAKAAVGQEPAYADFCLTDKYGLDTMAKTDYLCLEECHATLRCTAGAVVTSGREMKRI
jgi:hypothetical protein